MATSAFTTTTYLFDNKKTRKLIYVQLRSLRYYQPLLKKLEDNSQVKQLFDTDLLHVQHYLFTKLKIEPKSKVKVEYDYRSKVLGMVKVDDENNSEEKVILQQLSEYVQEKKPDIIVCMGDYDNGKVL